MSNYEAVALGEIARVRSGYAFKSADWRESGMPVIKIRCVKKGEVTLDGCSYVDSDVAERAASYLVRRGDTLIGMSGADLGQVGVAKFSFPTLLNQRVGKFEVVDASRLEYSYLQLFLKSPDAINYFREAGYGSAQPNISPAVIQSIEIPLPPLQKQRAIAQVLSVFDDLIDTNVTLVTEIDALVRAKVRSVVLAGEGDLEQRRLSEITVMLRRGISPKYLDSHNGDSVDVVNQRCVRNGRVDLAASRVSKLPSSLGERFLRQGDVLINSTGVGTLGRTAGWSSNRQGVTVDGHVTICRADPAIMNGNFLRYILREREDKLIGLGTGSTGQTELGKEELGTLLVPVIPLEDQEWVDPFVRALDGLSLEISELTQTRDTLLPLLLSGRITPNTATKLLENVTT